MVTNTENEKVHLPYTGKVYMQFTGKVVMHPKSEIGFRQLISKYSFFHYGQSFFVVVQLHCKKKTL